MDNNDNYTLSNSENNNNKNENNVDNQCNNYNIHTHKIYKHIINSNSIKETNCEIENNYLSSIKYDKEYSDNINPCPYFLNSTDYINEDTQGINNEDHKINHDQDTINFSFNFNSSVSFNRSENKENNSLKESPKSNTCNIDYSSQIQSEEAVDTIYNSNKSTYYSKTKDKINSPPKNDTNKSIIGIGGVLIAVRKNIKHERIVFKNYPVNTSNKKLYKVGISLLNTSNEIIINIIGIYRTPTFIANEDTWSQIQHSLNIDLRKNSIITGDLNAHHINWNCHKTDKNGNTLQNFISDLNMHVINDKTLSHMGDSNNMDSNIDLVIASEDLVASVNCHIGSDAWGSDHWPICTNILISTKPYVKKSNKISNIKTSWQEYKTILNSKKLDIIAELDQIKETTDKYEFICNTLRNTVRICSGKKVDSKPNTVPQIKPEKNQKDTNNKKDITSIKPNHNKSSSSQNNSNDSIIKNKNKNPVEWWDHDCEELIKKRQKFLKIWRTKRDPDSFQKYKSIIRETRKIFFRKKRNNYKKFIQGINKFISLSYVWKKAAVLKNSFTNVNWRSWQNKSRKDTILAEIEKLSPPQISNKLSLKIIPDHINNNPDVDNLNGKFTLEEITRAIDIGKNKKTAPGKVGIKYCMIALMPRINRKTKRYI